MAMGLNFKDVLVALGQIEDNMGGECSGMVGDVGSEVTRLKVGDRVCALPCNPYSTSVICNSSVVKMIPEEMSFATAASIPVIFCTAYHSLVNVARLYHGQSILIHAAAGGVGQAATMLAQILGAEVFATVGSKRKKEFLKETYGLADDHIFSSRNSAFGKYIRNATGDNGVDVVLNSLGGDLMTGGNCLARFGRFIEIGKRDILANMRLENGAVHKLYDFRFHGLGLIIQEKPELVQSLLSDVMDLLRKGTVRPASPITSFTVQDIKKGFRALHSGSLIGKVVFEPGLEDEVMVMPSTLPHSTFPPDAIYILTGGAGELERSMARWLVQQGAKNIVLASRRGRASHQVCELIAELETDAVKIVGYQCDVGKQDQVKKMINDITATMPPIRGVVHGAMVLHDMLFEQLSHYVCVSVVTPKVQGAWNLHGCLPKSGLDFFVLHSSVAGVIGSRGQAMYARTSTFLGAFAHWRRAQDLPATVIYLGAVSEVGYIAESTERQEIIAATYGEKGMSEKEFLAYLKVAIDGQLSKFSDHECVTSLKLEANLPEPYWAADAKFSHCRRAIVDGHRQESVDAPSIPTSHLLKQPRSMESATQVVYDNVAAKFSSILMIPAEDIVPSKPIVAYGLDSLVSVEIRNWIARELGAKMQLLEVLNSSSLRALAATIVRKSGFVNQNVFKMDAKEG